MGHKGQPYAPFLWIMTVLLHRLFMTDQRARAALVVRCRLVRRRGDLECGNSFADGIPHLIQLCRGDAVWRHHVNGIAQRPEQHTA